MASFFPLNSIPHLLAALVKRWKISFLNSWCLETDANSEFPELIEFWGKKRFQFQSGCSVKWPALCQSATIVKLNAPIKNYSLRCRDLVLLTIVTSFCFFFQNYLFKWIRAKTYPFEKIAMYFIIHSQVLVLITQFFCVCVFFLLEMKKKSILVALPNVNLAQYIWHQKQFWNAEMMTWNFVVKWREQKTKIINP